MDRFSLALTRSQAFADHLLGLFSADVEWFDDDLADAAGAAAELSFEHAHAIRVLFEAGAPNSAAAMLRLQYEALLRGAWLLYAAPEAQVDKLAAPLTQASADAAKNIASAEKMLEALERAATKAPNLRGLVMPLREMRDASWKAMNAFVHTGLHAIARTQDGFPAKLAGDILKNSNGLMHMAARLLARTTAPGELAIRVDKAYEGFEDVLPMVTPPAGA